MKIIFFQLKNVMKFLYMNTIKDLYYGKIKPNETEFRKGSENDALLMQIIKIEETLNTYTLLYSNALRDITNLIDEMNES